MMTFSTVPQFWEITLSFAENDGMLFVFLQIGTHDIRSCNHEQLPKYKKLCRNLELKQVNNN